MAFRRGFAAISFWLALPFGIACGIFTAMKAGNPFVFILGFMGGGVCYGGLCSDCPNAGACG